MSGSVTDNITAEIIKELTKIDYTFIIIFVCGILFIWIAVAINEWFCNPGFKKEHIDFARRILRRT
jgi:hypothetical protein